METNTHMSSQLAVHEVRLQAVEKQIVEAKNKIESVGNQTLSSIDMMKEDIAEIKSDVRSITDKVILHDEYFKDIKQSLKNLEDATEKNKINYLVLTAKIGAGLAILGFLIKLAVSAYLGG